jgi:outer membrane biosynthesis protein TonB
MTFHSADMRGIATRRLRYAIACFAAFAPAATLARKLPRLLTRDAPSLLQATLRSPPQPQIEPQPQCRPPPPRAVAPAPTLPPRRAHGNSHVGAGRHGRFPGSRSAAASPRAGAAPGVECPVLAATAAPAATAAATGRRAECLTGGQCLGRGARRLRGYRWRWLPRRGASSAIRRRRWLRAGPEPPNPRRSRQRRPAAPATVGRSSGHEVLDRAALTMIDAGALRARLPESLRGKAFAVVLPVVFNLDDE